MAPASTPAPADLPKPPPKRGRKPDPSTEPNKSRDLQRLYRARRVQQLEDLQSRVAFLEKENAELRRRLGEDVPSPASGGPSPSHALDSPAGSSLADSPAAGAHTPDVDIKPSLQLPFGGKPQIPGPEIDLSGVGRPPIGFSKGAAAATIAPSAHAHLVGQSPASEAGSPSPWAQAAHQHFNAAQNNLAAFGSPAAVGTPGPGPAGGAPFSPADTVWGAEMLQAVQAQAFAAASSGGTPGPAQHPNHALLAGLHGHHPFAHAFPAHMAYSPATRSVPSPSASTTYDLPTPHSHSHNPALHPSSPDLNMYSNPYGNPPSASNTPASSSAYSPWPSNSSASARLPDGTLAHTPGSLAAASPSSPAQPSRTRPFRPPPPTQELQRLFLQLCCAVPAGELPPVGLPPTQMSPFHIFCLVLLRGLELTGKGRTQRVSWTAEEEQKIAAAAANEVEEACCGGLLDCSGPLFEDEPSVLPMTAGFVKVAEAWQLLSSLPNHRFSSITLAESLLAAGSHDDSQSKQPVGLQEDSSKKRVSWNVRCEKGHGLLIQDSALAEVKKEVLDFAFGAGVGQARPTSATGASSLGLHGPSGPSGDEYDPKAAVLSMPWLQQHSHHTA